MPATIQDIARETGLAPSTVADILRGRSGYSADSRRRTVETAQRLHFVPNHFARSLQRQRSHTVGVAGSLTSTVVSGPTLKAIIDGLLPQGYIPVFCEASGKPGGLQRAVTELRARSVDAMVLHCGVDDRTLDAVLPRDFPCVMIQSAPYSSRPHIIAERFDPFSKGVHWLFARGHRRIAFLGADNAEAMLNPHNTHRLKIEGYCAAMQSLGLFDPALLLDAEFSEDGVGRFMAAHRRLLSSVTAILACNDRVAVAAMSALADLGLRVPQDCSVVGFDDTEFATAVRPRLTTFRPRREEIGARAVEMVLDLIEGRPVSSVRIVPELIERESAIARPAS
jgi:LacI family transcriptional regulator